MESASTALQRSAPALGVALASTIAGGLVAAVTAHAPTEHASWAAAYLVLVGGVATLGLAVGRARLSSRQVPGGRLLGELAAWIIGNALVIIGTLAEVTVLVDVGGALLVVALALVAVGVRGGRDACGGRDAPGRRAALGGGWLRGGWLRAGFTALVGVLLVSIPVGLVLARLRG